MAKLAIGQKMPDFLYDTPFKKGLRLSETVARGKTALIFLRYYGCTLCQYDIHELAKNHSELTAGGGKILVALQSDPEKLSSQLKPGSLPFDIVCDPGQDLYRKFDIAPAASKLSMARADTLVKLAKAAASGYKHGDYEGEELQLPAVFVVDKELTLSYAHYGKSVSDIPAIGELKGLLQ